MKYETALEMVKPCPFCGGAPKIMEKDWYEDLRENGDDGTACISVKCSECNVEMYDHSYAFPNYEDRLVLMVQKWNRRTKS